jgi:hypothetical protein
MTDEICRNYRIRPRTVAEITSIQMLLRSLEPLNAVALMPRISLRGAESLKLRSIRLEGKNLGLEIGVFAADRLGDEQRHGGLHKTGQSAHPEDDRGKRSVPAGGATPSRFQLS